MDRAQCRKLGRRAREAEILHWLEVRKMPPLSEYEQRCILIWAQEICPLDLLCPTEFFLVPGDEPPEVVVSMSHAMLYAYSWLGQFGLPGLRRPGPWYDRVVAVVRAHETLFTEALAYDADIRAGRRSPEIRVEDVMEAHARERERLEDWKRGAGSTLRFRWRLYTEREGARLDLERLLWGVRLEACNVPAAWLAAYRSFVGLSPWQAVDPSLLVGVLPCSSPAEVADCLRQTRSGEAMDAA